MAAMLLVSSASIACESATVSQVATALDQGIALNERFKRTVAAQQEAKARQLRREVEQYDESTAMPCVSRAATLLDRRIDKRLLDNLLRFAVSHENSADERVSEAVASVFVRHPDAVVQAIAGFSRHDSRILVRAIEAGWPGVAATLGRTTRQDRERRLQALQRSNRPN